MTQFLTNRVSFVHGVTELVLVLVGYRSERELIRVLILEAICLAQLLVFDVQMFLTFNVLVFRVTLLVFQCIVFVYIECLFSLNEANTLFIKQR